MSHRRRAGGPYSPPRWTNSFTNSSAFSSKGYSFGSLGMPPEYAETLRQAGCRVVFFRPLNPLDIRVNKRNHWRILVVEALMTVGHCSELSGRSAPWGSPFAVSPVRPASRS